MDCLKLHSQWFSLLINVRTRTMNVRVHSVAGPIRTRCPAHEPISKWHIQYRNYIWRIADNSRIFVNSYT